MKKQGIVLNVLHTESVYSRGGEKYLFELLVRVAKTRKVHLYLHNIDPEWRRRYKNSHVFIHTLWNPPRLFWPLLPLTLCVNFLQLKKNIRRNDIVFATNFPMNFLAVVTSQNAICHCFEPLAIFYDPVRIASLSVFSRFCVTIAKLLYAGLDVWAYNQSTVFTALGSSVEPYILKTYGRRPDVFLPNGVDSNYFSPYPSSKNDSRKTVIIGHSTDYTIFKGTEDFLKIIARLKQTGIRFVVYISESITDNEVKKKYQEYVRNTGIDDVVFFVGNVNESDLASFYRSLDVFVYTGSPECAGGSTASLSVLEAQSCSVPVIRSRGDNHEIKDGTTGFYIDPHNHRGACNTLDRLLRMSLSDKRLMSHNARNYVKRHFNWDSTVRVLTTTINSLIQP